MLQKEFSEGAHLNCPPMGSVHDALILPGELHKTWYSMGSTENNVLGCITFFFIKVYTALQLSE